MSARLISIIGPPGVGKTTLARYVAEEFSATILYEDYAGNPFLADSFAGDANSALPAQLYYLLGRVGQLSRTSLPASGVVVSDYGFCQDRIYAEKRLCEKDMRIYDGVASQLDPAVQPPDLIILLDAPAEVLLERISQRGRDFEKSFTEDFLDSMRRAYNNIEQTVNCEVIRVDCQSVNIRNPHGRMKILAKIRGKI